MASDEKLFQPQMPEVDIRPDIEKIFDRARSSADESVIDEEGLYRRQVIIVTPGRLLISKACPLPVELDQEEINRLTGLLPVNPPKNIAVIACTYLEALKKDIFKAIPFFGYLLGFAAVGHKVWVFEGHPSALAAGCRDADLLIIDSGLLSFTAKLADWQSIALESMRGNQIKIIPRDQNQ
jgi:hypothetical protein